MYTKVRIKVTCYWGFLCSSYVVAFLAGGRGVESSTNLHCFQGSSFPYNYQACMTLINIKQGEK